MHHAMHIMTENGALHGVYVIHTIYISGGMTEEGTRDVNFFCTTSYCHGRNGAWGSGEIMQ